MFKGYGDNSSDYISDEDESFDTLGEYNEVYQAEYEVELDN
jgi:hypothetical protein